MRPLRPLLTFVAVLLAGAGAWSAVGGAWTAGFQATVEALLNAPGLSTSALVEPVGGAGPGEVPALDTRIVLANAAHVAELRAGARAQIPTASWEMSSRYGGYLDLCFVLALFAATPMTWRRRAWAMPLGLGLSALLVGARVVLAALYHADAFPALGLVSLVEPLRTLVQGTFESFVRDNLEAGMVLGLLVWAPLAFPPDAWARWFGEGALQDPESAE